MITRHIIERNILLAIQDPDVFIPTSVIRSCFPCIIVWDGLNFEQLSDLSAGNRVQWILPMKIVSDIVTRGIGCDMLDRTSPV